MPFLLAASLQRFKVQARHEIRNRGPEEAAVIIVSDVAGHGHSKVAIYDDINHDGKCYYLLSP